MIRGLGLAVCHWLGLGARRDEWTKDTDLGTRRILGRGRRIFIVLEMRHLVGTKVEKAAWLLLE